MILAAEDCFGADRARHIQVSSDFHAEETLGRDTDDLERTKPQCELSADDVRVAAVFAKPERMADDNARRAGPALVILCGNESAQDRSYAQGVEKVAAHPHSARE